MNKQTNTEEDNSGKSFPKILGLTRCLKENGHSIDGWSAHRKYNGVSLRKYFSDTKLGGIDKSWNKARLFVTRLNKVVDELRSKNYS